LPVGLAHVEALQRQQVVSNDVDDALASRYAIVVRSRRRPTEQVGQVVEHGTGLTVSIERHLWPLVGNFRHVVVTDAADLQDEWFGVAALVDLLRRDVIDRATDRASEVLGLVAIRDDAVVGTPGTRAVGGDGDAREERT